MIIKITRGVSASRALAYDYGPGRAQEHHRPHRVAGTALGRDWRERARAMDTRLRQAGDSAPGTPGRVHRLAVACSPDDRVLSDREWAVIAHRTVHEYTGDAAKYSWEAVRHDPRHIHISVLQRGNDGKLFNDSFTKRRVQRICDGVERDHNLVRVKRSRTTDRAQSRQAAVQRRARQRDARNKQQQAMRAQNTERRHHIKAEHAGSPQPASAPARDNLGWTNARLAERIGHPRPSDWDTLTDQQRRQWLRERLPQPQPGRPDQHQTRHRPGPGLEVTTPHDSRAGQSADRGRERNTDFGKKPRDWEHMSTQQRTAWYRQVAEARQRDREAQAQRHRDDRDYER